MVTVIVAAGCLLAGMVLGKLYGATAVSALEARVKTLEAAVIKKI